MGIVPCHNDPMPGNFLVRADPQELIERYCGQIAARSARPRHGRVGGADMKLGSWTVQQRRLSDRDPGYQKYGMWNMAGSAWCSIIPNGRTGGAGSERRVHSRSAVPPKPAVRALLHPRSRLPSLF
ncbi:hypothetical protein [Aquamicrobium defluvii]|uniref:hypothetical protein n=1 Tax=Aquamicrobium defluvii TaxID=69279 RepID=UPI00105E7A3C|nr:hypothetical protein [Aquamicrobium defluvii]